MQKDLWGKRPSLGGSRKEGSRFGAIHGRRWAAGDRTTSGRQPQLDHQLGEKSGVWQGLESDARRKSGVGGGGRIVDLCREKKDDCWLWWAIDRASKRVLGWALGDRGTETAERLDAQLPHASHIIFATDFWHPYGNIFSEENHVQGKAHTFTIESLNNRIRCYLARLKRRTHNYSKSKANLAASILFFIINKCGGELVPNAQSIPV